MLNFQKILRSVGLVLVVMLGGMILISCASAHLMMRYGDLKTQTKMSESVFLELRTDLPKTVYVAEGSTLGRDLTILPSLQQHLMDMGYSLIEAPGEATYVVQINHLHLAEVELNADQTLEDALSSAYSAGAGSGLAADLFGASGEAVLGVGLVVGVLSLIADSQTKHIAHTLTTDVLVTETTSKAGQESELIYHKTRIVSGASKVNLSLEEALPAMVQGLRTSLSGLLRRAS